MSGISLTMEAERYPALKRQLDGIAARMASMRPLMTDIGSYLDMTVNRRFIGQRGPGGVPWEPSAAALARGGKTLIDSARLMQSFSYNATDFSVEEGTNVIYAAIYQFGGTIKREARTQTIYRRYNEASGELSSRFVKRSKSNFATDHAVGEHEINVVARPMLGIDKDDEREISALVDDYIMGGIQ